MILILIKDDDTECIYFNQNGKYFLNSLNSDL